MRTSLFLSTLFAVSLLGGAALAEKSGPGATPKEPRTVERLRIHGDTVDKSYGGASKAARPGASGTPSTQAPTRGKARVDPGANRVNCSDTGVDCRAAKGKAQSNVQGGGDGASGSGRSARAPAFLDKILGSDRTNFNEAGEDQGMSLRASKRAWASASSTHRGGDEVVGDGESGGAAGSRVQKVDRKQGQASDARMASNEDDVGFMPVKAARKEWAKASIDAGTWKGPAREPVTNAARRIAEQRAAEGATAPADKKAEAKGKGRAEEHADHPH